MRKLLIALVACFVAAIAYASPGSPYLSYGWRSSGGGGGYTISNVQNWANHTAFNSTNTITLGVNPTAGNLLVCVANLGSATATATFADTIGDSGTWANTATSPHTNSFTGSTTYIFWKVVTGSVSGNTITSTASGSVGQELYCAEYATTGGTWSLDGTPTAADGSPSANPAPGAITTTMTNGLIIGAVEVNGATSPTAGTGYTKQSTATRINQSAVEDDNIAGTITSTAGSNNPNWTLASTYWSAMGVAFKAQ